MAKDFFDEELEKLEQQKAERQKLKQERNQQNLNDWYSYNEPTTAPVQTQSNPLRRPWVIAVMCLALVLAIALGWVLSSIFGTSGTLSKDEQPVYVATIIESLRAQGIDITEENVTEALKYANMMVDEGHIKQEALIVAVFDYLRQNYYKPIDDEKWTEAVAAAGTAFLQTAGDRFCQLMSPQAFYNYLNQVGTESKYPTDTYFGISYSYSSGLGLYVSAVSTDSSCYGLVEEGDIVLKMTQVTYNDQLIENFGLDITKLDEFAITDFDSEAIVDQLTAIQSANYRVLRNGDVLDTGIIERGGIGLESSDYNYEFIEFYFGPNCHNISTTNQNNAKHNTYELRGLDKLPADTGYIRISEFMYYKLNNKEVTAADEFKEVMQLFKSQNLSRLVLDLKGNPGGRVDAVCEIASLLVTAAKLDASQRDLVVTGNRLLITALIPRDSSARQNELRTSSYEKYFGTPSDICDIVVWTDSGSASASELLTGALTDYQTGFQIGTRTYGKGIAQTIVPLSYSGTIINSSGRKETYPWAIYYTFAAYYSPLGTNIHGVGYAPQIGYDNVKDYVSKNGSVTLWDATYAYWGLTK